MLQFLIATESNMFWIENVRITISFRAILGKPVISDINID